MESKFPFLGFLDDFGAFYADKILERFKTSTIDALLDVFPGKCTIFPNCLSTLK